MGRGLGQGLLTLVFFHDSIHTFRVAGAGQGTRGEV